MTAAADDQTVGQVAATSKLYVLAALDETRIAAQNFLLHLQRIRRKYVAELSAGDEQFALLLAAAERWGAA